MADTLSLLDAGALPVTELAVLARREGWRPRPIYQVHRWFARRFPSAFRALLTAAALPAAADLWQPYYDGTDWRGRTVLDPFVGGGTSVVEAQRLGANVVGVDVDPVACAITQFETHAGETPDLLPILAELQRSVGALMAPFYRTTAADGAPRTILHAFWVQVVECTRCAEPIEVHPHYRLAHEAAGSRQWAFCRQCHHVAVLDRSAQLLGCEQCGATTPISAGPVRLGRLTCPHCGTRERLIDVAPRTGRPPAWRLFALETLGADVGRRVGLADRHFQAATSADLAVLDESRRALAARLGADGAVTGIPERRIPREGRSDRRLIAYGYEHYRDLFNPRQLLHLSLLAEAIDGVPEPARRALALAFSDHLTTNCMLTSYASGWRRLAPLFSIRAYRHITRPVEINPWLDGTGRGTFPNAVRQIQRAVASVRRPLEPDRAGGFRPVASRPGAARIIHGSARRLVAISDASVDFVLTDPPYFDNIAYAELSDFFLPWLQRFGLAPADGDGPSALSESLTARRRDAAATRAFELALGDCFREIACVLIPTGRLVFTYRHRTAAAWSALAGALASGRFRVIQVFPLLGDGRGGLHARRGTSRWDAVFVARHADSVEPDPTTLSGGAARQARAHYARWAARLAADPASDFGPADRQSFFRACLVASALGMFPPEPSEDDAGRPLAAALAEEPPSEEMPRCHT